MIQTVDELRKAIREHKLELFEEQIVKIAKSAVYMDLAPISDVARLPIGASKIGGNPDLPTDFEWQMYNGRPLTFIGQFVLSELAKHLQPEHNPLPEQGRLYFFYEADEVPWGEPEQQNGWQLVYLPDEKADLEHREHPVAEGVYNKIQALPEHSIAFRSGFSLPSTSEDRFKEKTGIDFYNVTDDSGDALEDAYWALRSAVSALRKKDANWNAGHYFLGYPDPIQGDVSWEVAMHSEEFRAYYIPTHDLDARRDAIRRQSKNWQFLFQIDSDDRLNAMWGDAGILYILIPKKSLA
ncbi:MAG: YwqG family protein, partial [Chloroflexota bacterium]